MQLAFLYAGQGSQTVGMGKDLYETFPTFQRCFDCLSPALRQLAFAGPAEALAQTENTQPILVAFAAGVSALLREAGLRPAFVAGLSLGEYSALQAAGVFTPQQAVDLVAFRGREMTRAAQGIDCKMVAVLQLSRALLAQCCEQASALGVVCIANYNCPGQLVIGGESAAVDAACALAIEKGARRCLPLNVSGPFHTPLMARAGAALQERFKQEKFGALEFPVVFNTTAQPLQATENIPALLCRQVQSSVYFEDSIRYLKAQGVDTIVEIGPGTVLSGFVKKTEPTMNSYAIQDAASLAAALAACASPR